MPRTLQKVFGSGGWVGGGGGWWLTVNLVFCFGPKLWFWTWTKLNNYCAYTEGWGTEIVNKFYIITAPDINVEGISFIF